MASTTSSDQPAVSLLRTDALGRLRTPPGRREELLDEFDRSGLSGAKFAELAGVRYSTFASWVQKRRRRRKPGGRSAVPHRPRLIEAVVEEPVGDGGEVLRLELPGGAVFELHHRKQVPLAVEFLKALARAC